MLRVLKCRSGVRLLYFVLVLIGSVLSLLSFAGLTFSLRAAEAEQREFTVVPQETDQPLPNPYMGWGIWAGPRDWEFKNFTVQDNTTAYPDDAPLFNWVMLDWNWSDLERQEGKFTWDDFDQVVNYWSSRHKQFVVRLWVTDDPGWNGDPGTNPIPNWLWSKGLRFREYKGNGGARKREPDYGDVSYQRIYLPALRKLLNSFAAKYDRRGSPVILLQIMGYGHWADFATWFSHYPWPSAEREREVLTGLMQVYVDTFQHIQLLYTVNGEWNHAWEKTLQDRLYRKALDFALAHNAALIWTGFIDGPSWIDGQLVDKYWPGYPIIAEDNWDYLEIKDQRTHGTLEENLDGMLAFHANFAHYYVRSTTYARAMREDHSNFERGLRRGGLGYRLTPISLSWPREVAAGNVLVFRQQWVNRNVGYMYLRFPLKLYLTNDRGEEKFSQEDEQLDETSWIQGTIYPVFTTFHLPKNLAPGKYDLRIALVDYSGKPRISLPIQGEDDQKRYTIGEIRILPPTGKAACESQYCPDRAPAN